MSRYRTEVELVITLDVTLEDAVSEEDAMRQARRLVMDNKVPWSTWPVVGAYARTHEAYPVNQYGLVD